MSDVILISGTRKGLGRHLPEHYLARGWRVAGCSRGETSLQHDSYSHFQLDVADERAVVQMIHAVTGGELPRRATRRERAATVFGGR